MAGSIGDLSGSLAPMNRGHGITILLPNDSKTYVGEKTPQTEVKITWPTPKALMQASGVKTVV